MNIKYRLGLDLGANSIGWCALRLADDGTPCGLLDMGVRVYPDGRNPKDGSSLAAQRRGPRAMRRNRDRYLRRRQNRKWGKSPGTQMQHTLEIGMKSTELRRFLA